MYLVTALLLVWSVLWMTTPASGVTARKSKTSPKTAAKRAAPVATKKAPAKAKRRPAARRPVRRVYKQPTYADATLGDNVDGEDLPVRRAAVEALGGYNGSVVVVDPSNGRVLTIVNQRMAFQSGFTPCSTIKIVTALAALNEGIIERTTPVRISRRLTLDLTNALALSGLSNGYFGNLGKKVGFERVRYYAQQFGLGEKAGWDIPEEQAGILPERPPVEGGVVLMTAYGTGISQTPLELAAFVAAIANGGTLYYLQYPRTQAEIQAFDPKVKRELEVIRWLDDLRIGMRASVDYGSGRRANFDGLSTVLGKTGTCTDFGKSAHLGWFGAYNEVGRKLAVVVLLTGGHAVNGPVAAGVAGQVFRNLSAENLLADASRVSSVGCCGR
jgi:cell division protein FtsI/penicillin-binding protein 2